MSRALKCALHGPRFPHNKFLNSDFLLTLLRKKKTRKKFIGGRSYFEELLQAVLQTRLLNTGVLR